MAGEKEATLILRIKQFGQENLENIKESLMSVGKFAGIAASAIIAAAVAGINAFKEEELAINRLNQSMVNNGDFSVEASKDLIEFASQLQKTSTIADDAAIGMLALAKGFGVSNEEAKKLVQAAADLSAATGMDLESAVKQLGATLGGATGKIGMLIPSMKELTEEQLKSGAAIDLVANKFKGSAEATIQGLGALDQLKNSFGDLVELIGQGVAPFVVFFAKELSNLSNEASKSSLIFDSFAETTEFLAKSISVVKNVVMGLGEYIGTALGAYIGVLGNLVKGEFAKAIETASLGFDEIGTVFKERKQTLNDELEAIDQIREQQDIDRKLREEQLLRQSSTNKTAIARGQLADLRKAEDEYRKDKAKKDAERLKAEAAFSQTRVDIASGAANLITAVAGRESKLAFLVSKAAAIAQSIVSTKVAVANALATVPFPANAAAASNVAIAGALNTAAIVATGIQGLAEGGIVKARPGGIIANIGEGGQDEAVIPLDRMGGMMGNVTINLNGPVLGDREQARQFAVEIDKQLLELRRNNESVSFDSSIA